jgi:hypothetical protein
MSFQPSREGKPIENWDKTSAKTTNNRLISKTVMISTGWSVPLRSLLWVLEGFIRFFPHAAVIKRLPCRIFYHLWEDVSIPSDFSIFEPIFRQLPSAAMGRWAPIKAMGARHFPATSSGICHLSRLHISRFSSGAATWSRRNTERNLGTCGWLEH